mmetsp:Transcript_10376/g.31947  ORF Transcript_10376/g.31947 Transcript_10376/m.31947 type:complete len:289 (+) Transcript_10376:92-958(+)
MSSFTFAQLQRALIRRVNVSRRTGRYYQVDGFDNLFPSVTTILGVVNKPGLAMWQKRLMVDQLRKDLSVELPSTSTDEWVNTILSQASEKADAQRDAAADFGTRAHLAIDKQCENLEQPVEVDADLHGVMAGFKQWYQGAGLQLVQTERMVFSPQYQYAGAVDAIAKRPGHDGLVVLDWKTSNSIFAEHGMQLSAYAKAIEEMFGEKVTEGWVVQFNKGNETPGFSAYRIRIEESYTSFSAALHLFHAQNTNLFDYSASQKCVAGEWKPVTTKEIPLEKQTPTWQTIE